MMRDIFEQQVQVGVEKQPSNEDEKTTKSVIGKSEIKKMTNDKARV